MGDLTWWTVLLVASVGFGSGVLSGMFGVGGAVLSTPGIRALGATPIEAVGSTIPAILPSALSGTVRYARAGLVDWRVGLTCGATGAVAAAGGALVADAVDGRILMVLTAALLAWSGTSLLRSAAHAPQAPAADPAPVVAAEDADAEDAEAAVPADDGDPSTGRFAGRGPLLAGVGAASGFVAGLLGVGGGVVMMPVFTRVLRLPVKVAVASSLVAVAIFSVPALLTHALTDHVAWEYAIPLVVGVIPGAQVGARVTIGVSEATVRRWGGLFFLALAVVFGGTELAGLVTS